MNHGERILDSCTRWLGPGDLGDTLRGEDYRRLISCGLTPALVGGGDIGKVHTSCAVFARAILHDAGVQRVTGPARAGQGMWHGWLGALSPQHRAWVPYHAADHSTGGREPVPGSLFYVEKPGTNNNHVGFLLTETAPGVWRTAEGGGGDGTRCHFGSRTLGPGFSTGRLLIGWFDPELIGDVAERDTEPPPPVLDNDRAKADALMELTKEQVP